MAFFDENTSVFRMKRDFDQFVQDQESDVPVLDLDITGDVTGSNFSGDTDSLSVRRLLEKEKQIKSKESEYIDARNKIFRLEHRLSQMENNSKKAKLDYEQTISSLNSDKAHVEDMYANLMTKIKFLEDKDVQSREKLLDREKEIENQRKRYEEKILTLQKERIQMSDEIQQEKEEDREKIAHLKREMMRNETELKICQCELEETKAQLKLQLKRSTEISNQMKDCEELRHKQNQAEQKIKDLELQISRMEEDSLIGKSMKSQVTTFKDMEKENRKLNDENQYLKAIQENNLLLKEQHDSMKNKCERLEEKVSQCAKLMAENESLKSKLSEWQGGGKSDLKIRSPSDLSKRIIDLQNSEALLVLKQGELQTSVHVKEKTIHSLQEQVNSLQQQLNDVKTRQLQDGELIKRLKRKLLLVTKERDGFKRILDTYEAESSVLGTSAGTQSHVQELQQNLQTYKEQTEMLEAELFKSKEELTSCKLHVKQLEQLLAKSQQNKSMNGTSTDETDQQIVLHLREKIAHLEKSLEKCEADKYTLECRIEQRHLQGDYDPTKLKVLHFKMNPADVGTAERQVELSKLKEENERLKQRIKLLEENEGTIEDLTVAVERKLMEPGSSKDIEEMRSQLATAELKNKRLMEAFTKTSQEIREVCYQLTGYKIDIPTSNQYRLTSMYADSANDFLMFKQNSSGVIEMLGTSFSSTVGDLMDLYLIQRDSIPAFLSAVTLELFSRQTMQFS